MQADLGQLTEQHARELEAAQARGEAAEAAMLAADKCARASQEAAEEAAADVLAAQERAAAAQRCAV